MKTVEGLSNWRLPDYNWIRYCKNKIGELTNWKFEEK